MGGMKTETDHVAIAPRPGHYQIDAGRSVVTFRTRHLFGLAPVRGEVAFRAGTITIAEPLTASSIDAEIDTATFHTANAQRDQSVLSARFLDAERYPVMTFRSDGISADGRAIAGALTVRDIAGPVSLAIREWTVSAQSFTAVAVVRIDRAAFGVTAARGLAARYLEISAAVHGVLQ